MIHSAHFKIDPRLAMLLGETYRSTEHALKELVDNAWDAEAGHVWITLPDPMTADPIVIKDDGCGMDESEVRKEYLMVARDRRSSRGDRTVRENRQVKGRKGIGKFAGLMAADIMQLETRANGMITYLTIPRHELLKAEMDLEQFELLITTLECPPSEHGTVITLSDLNQSFSFPSPEKLKELLLLEYGQQTDFKIYVNGDLLDIEDVTGDSFAHEADLPGVGHVRLRFKMVDRRQKLKNAGIAVRVGGKIVGRPGYFGLDEEEDMPHKILKQLFGEVEADGLADDTTADWGAFVENSKAFQIMGQWVRQQLHQEVVRKCRKDAGLAKTRLKKEINQRLALLPEYRREYGEQVMERLMLRCYDQSEERMKPIVSVVLDALEGIPERSRQGGDG